MYHVNAQGVDEHIINVHYYYYHAGTVDFVSPLEHQRVVVFVCGALTSCCR